MSIRLKERLMAVQKTAQHFLNITNSERNRDFYLKVLNKAVFKLKHFFDFECNNYQNIYWNDIPFVDKSYLQKFLLI